LSPRPRIAFAIWLLRQAQGLTQKELGRKIHRSRQWISQVESGWKKPTIESLRLLARALKVPLSLLLRISEIVR